MDNTPNSRALAVQLLNQAANLIRGMEQSNLPSSTENLPSSSQSHVFTNSSSVSSNFPRNMSPVSSFSVTPGQNTQGTVRVVAPQNNPFRMTSRPSSSVLSEMRQQFSPYSTSGRRRGNQLRTGSSPSTSIVNLQMFCLGGPRDTTTPDINRKSYLMALDLAQGVVSIARGATSTQLETAIRAEYPRLGNVEFEVLRAIGQGTIKPLQRLSRTLSIPAPAVIKDLRVTVSYIRPLENIIPVETEDVSEEAHESLSEGQAPSTSTRSSFQQLFGRPSSLLNTATSSLASTLGDNQQVQGGFTFPDEGNNVPDTIDEIGLYRESLFDTNEGREMVVVSSRENIMHELLGIYKNPSFNFKKKTWVMFAGEEGRDVNGLTREFFSIGISSLQNGKIGNHPLFEGQLDHLLPTCDPFLLNAGYFKVLGKFMAHAAVHVGVGFIGLSRSVVKYLFQKDGEEPLIEYSIQDIPDFEIRSAAQLMQEWTLLNREDVPCSDSVQKIKKALEEAQIFELPTSENIHFLFQQYVMWCTILCRATFLNEIREGFKSTGFMDFFQERDHLLAIVFPSDSSLHYTAQDVLSKISYIGEDIIGIRDLFEPIVEELDSNMIRKLLQCWTGFPVIPSDGLTVKGMADVPFVIHTCFNQIVFPPSITSAVLKRSVYHALEYCTYGFGSV